MNESCICTTPIRTRWATIFSTVAAAMITLPAAAQCGNANDCCVGNATGGCSDVACCEAVCACDPFCCDTAWDGFCAGGGFVPGCGAAILCPDLCEGPGECDPPLECPKGATVEDEPNCGVPIDEVNGGCNYVPNLFAPISCGETVCGTGTFDGATRDLDWYEITVGVETELVFTVTAEFGSELFIVAAPCPGVLLAFTPGSPCSPATVSACVAPGTYYVIAAPSFAAPIDCLDYVGTLECNTPCEAQACCFSDGSCEDLTEPNCLGAGGTPQGAGTDCSTTTCPQICGKTNPNDCCVASPTGTPGCSDAECCDLVCSADPFCCDVAWDGICAGAALANCAVCNVPGACCLPDGSCISVSPIECLNSGGDPQGAGTLCGDVVCPVICGKSNPNDCCAVNATPGCNDADCCESVCAVDPFCCDVAWDGLCVGQAIQLCGICPAPENDNCADRIDVDNGSTEFSNVGATTDGPSTCGLLAADIWFNYTASCTGDVTFDTFGSGFDTVLAIYDGCTCPTPPASNCCVPNGGLGCDNAECQAAVCAADAFCCDVAWDGLCSGAALTLCAELCATGGSPQLGCNDDSGGTLQSELIISVVEGNCYKIQIGGFAGSFGDGVLNITKGAGQTDCPADLFPVGAGDGEVGPGDLGELLANWGPCGGDEGCGCPADIFPPGATSNCCEANGGLGCDNDECEAAVCGADAFCCDVAWDGLCAAAAQDLCAELCGAVQGDGVVGPGDLGELLANWGDCFGCEPIPVECPDGGIQEDEPNCGLPTDTVNGGCNYVPELFAAIECGDTVCGNGAFDGATRDLDWYELNLKEDTQVTLTVTAEFASELFFVQAPCPGGTFFFVGGPACTETVLTQCLTAGTWYVVIAPSFATPVGCPSDYVGTLTCEGGCVAPSTCCFASGGLGCDDPECTDLICGQDPFCCDVAWDGLCADAANAQCEVCMGG